MTTTLLIDGNNVAHRVFYALPAIFKDSDRNGPRVETLFGFLRETLKLLDQFAPTRAAFFFDAKTNKRREVMPYYKDKDTKPVTAAFPDLKDKRHLYRQLDSLPLLLKELGFANVFTADGYEADDLIAEACLTLAGEKIIVSTDQDLWQCLDDEVHQYDHMHSRMHTAHSFRKEKGVTPRQWAKVKAMAGCVSDGVPGVTGIGEVYAIRYLRDELSKDSVAYKRIKAGTAVIERNTKLVKLPYPGTPALAMRDDDLVWARWPRILRAYGVDGLRHPEMEERDVYAPRH